MSAPQTPTHHPVQNGHRNILDMNEFSFPSLTPMIFLTGSMISDDLKRCVKEWQTNAKTNI
tara:strand:+ start:15294 stop:15476 length:183 start_codon:yes stop_codon:yes gene_type:complete